MKRGTLTKTLCKSKLYLHKASPTILSVAAAAGVVATALIAVRSTPKAMKLLEKKTDEKEKITKLEIAKTVAPTYIPSAIVCFSTIACIFGANLINTKYQAALISAYTMVSNSYKEYRKKVKELYGEEAHEKVVNSIVNEKCSDTHIICPGFVSDSTLDFEEGKEPEVVRQFYDAFSDRYFESTISKVIQAEYHLNRNFMFSGIISLNEFYDFLGLEKIQGGDELRWASGDGDIFWIDFNHYKCELEDGMEVFVIDMVFEPSTEWVDYI